MASVGPSLTLPSTPRPIILFPTPSGEAKQGEELRLQAALAGIPLLSFRCPLSGEASLRVRLPRRYPEAPLLPTVDGTPQLEAGMRAAIQAAAVGEASRCSGELRREPHCLQVLGEAKLALIEFAERAGEVAVEDYGDATGAVKASRALKTERAVSSNDARRAHPSRTARCGHQTAGFVEGGWADTSGERRKDGRRGGGIGEGASGKGRSAELGSTTSGEVVGGADAFLGRRLIYSHHIIAQQKRTGIVATARELGLGGFSKASVFVFGFAFVFSLLLICDPTSSSSRTNGEATKPRAIAAIALSTRPASCIPRRPL